MAKRQKTKSGFKSVVVPETELTEFEKQRLENIARNQELLKTLELLPLENSISSLRRQQPAKPKPKKKNEKIISRRRSSRISGEKLSMSDAVDLFLQKPTQETLNEGIVNSSVTVLTTKRGKIKAEIDGGQESEALSKKLFIILGKYNNMDKPINISEAEHKIERLSKIFNELSLNFSEKLLKQRITCASWHPEKSSRILAVGDKIGSLAFWQVPEDKNLKEIESSGNLGFKSDEDNVFTFSPHTGSISSLKFHSTDRSKLFTTSYDGSLRYLDINTHHFEEIYFTEQADNFLSSLDLHCSSPDILYFGKKLGQLFQLDTRETKNTTRFLKASTSKITNSMLNPDNQYQIITSGLERCFKIWDIRKLEWLSDVEQTTVATNFLFEFKHSKSCTSAYWNSTGQSIVSTSYDNTVKTFDSSNVEDKNLKIIASISRNNNTGRWVTPLRAVFSPPVASEQAVLIASMSRPIDVYNSKTGSKICSLFNEEHVTAIPSVICVRDDWLIAGANASGKCYIW
ncbi:hypothetical protein HK096_009057, partial [Nowakowskiella sp. JEL0078]